MTLASNALGRFLGLPPARNPDVQVQRDLRIPMGDGERLLADRHHPATDERAPLVLLRTPYGRGGMGLMARLIAERGYQVLVVSLRGTSGSSGRFTGFTLEPADVPATMAWLRAQPWFPGVMATWGASYLGYVQWALATEPIPEWKAAIIQDAPSEVYETFMYRGGAFALSDWLGWVQSMHALDAPGGESPVRGTLRMLPDARRRLRATAHLPVTEADRIAAGASVDFFQEWLRHPEPGDYWAGMDHRGNVANMPPVVYLAGGWHDIFLPGTLADDVALRTSGRDVRLLVGPWTHGAGMFSRAYQRDVFAVLDHALRGTGDLPRAPVRVHVAGTKEWREFDRWPPPGYRPQPWYLHPGGELASRDPQACAPSRYRYDPADPTPATGRAVLAQGVRTGVTSNRRLEARPDVRLFTTPALPGDLEVIGPVTAEIHLRSTRDHTDVVARLCDVAPNGRSTVVCDGIIRLDASTETGPDGVRVARVALWPTAYRFKRGHRVRLQVASGAHPRYLRNLGTGDQLGTRMLPADQEVFHDPEHPSALYLPVHQQASTAP